MHRLRLIHIINTLPSRQYIVFAIGIFVPHNVLMMAAWDHTHTSRF